MAKSNTVASPSPKAPTAPGDDAQPKVRSIPQRGKRMRVLGGGEGDFCIYRIAQAGDDLPQGVLIPLPEVPRFASTVEATRWLRANGEQLVGMQVMVLCAREIIAIRAQTRPSIELVSKPRIAVDDPKQEAAAAT